MSKVIKSSRVSLGVQMELDSPKVIKKAGNGIQKIQQAEIIEETKEELESVEQKVEKTKEEIEEMYIEEARKKSELFFEEEMKRAYNEGLSRVQSEADEIIINAKTEAERIIDEAVKMKNNIANDYNMTMQCMEKDIIDLVIEVAQKVVAKEIKKPDYIVGLVSEAVGKVASKKDTILKVAEVDYEYILENKEKILLNVEGFGEVDIQKESSLESGSCIVESQFGIIDGSLKTRMNQIENEVQKILNR